MSFNWNTEDESLWQESDSPDPNPQRRRWLWFIPVLAVLGLAAWFTWGEVRDRVSEATESVKEDVRSSHRLAQEATRRGDSELLTPLLSGRDSRWTEVQKERLEKGLLFADASRPLGLTPGPKQGEILTVTLNSELTAAELVAAKSYPVRVAPGITESVTLLQTNVYRMGSSRWLLSPPTAEFWGGVASTERRNITVRYPRRDEAIALRLSNDLEDALSEMCSTLAGASCPDWLTIHVELDSDANSVLMAADPLVMLGGGSDVRLPTPSLVGMPADEAAYRALYRGYARYVLSRAISRLAGYDCCNGVVFLQALLDRQMIELRLLTEPYNAVDDLYLIDEPASLSYLARLWQNEDPVAVGMVAPHLIHTFLDFLSQSSIAAEDFELQQALADANQSMWRWLGQISEDEVNRNSEEQFQLQWQEFLEATIASGQAARSSSGDVDLPAEDVLLTCGNEVLNLYAYDPQSGNLRKVLDTDFEFGIVQALPDHSGYFLVGQLPTRGEDVRIQTLLARGGDEPVVVADTALDGAVFIPWGTYSLSRDSVFSWVIDPNSANEPRFALVDVASCSPDGCNLTDVPGLPRWSPSGERLLVQALSDDSRIEIKRGPDADWEFLVRGEQPFWLDDATVAFLESPGSPGQSRVVRDELLAVAIDGGEPVQLIDEQALRESWPLEDRPSDISIRLAAPHPLRADSFLVLAVDADDFDRPGQLLMVTRDAGQDSWFEGIPTVRLLASDIATDVSDLSLEDPFSPDGRWLFLDRRTSDFGGDYSEAVIFDLLREERALRSAANADREFWELASSWTVDSSWFVRPLEKSIDLISPGQIVNGKPLRQIVYHDFQRCMSVSWVQSP